jgi:hypothetical protein
MPHKGNFRRQRLTDISTKDRFRMMRLKDNLTFIGPDGLPQIKELCIDIDRI